MKRALPLVFLACSSQPPAPPPPPPPMVEHPAVLTQHNDNLRTGANLRETALSPSTVTKDRFGVLFERSVQGYVYAQPLFVPDLTIGGKAHDVVFVCTEHDDVYAFDADDALAGDPLWHVNLGTPVTSQHLDVYQGTPYRDIIPEVGITSTPVIDLASGTMWVYAQTEDNGVFDNQLYALDIATGAKKNSRQIVVGQIEQKFLLQRPGMALAGNILWIAGGGHGDFGNYHGWIQAFDKTTLELKGTYLTTPNGDFGGIWQSGNGPAIDDEGAVYFETGNGEFDETTNPPNIGNSFGKVRLDTNGLALVDFFTPFNHAQLDAEDGDLGSSGPVLLPNTHLVVGGGKQGKLYLLDRGNLGHVHAVDDDQAVQSFQATFGAQSKHIHAGPVYWEGPTGARVYVLSESDSIRAYRFDGKQFETTAFTQTVVTMPPGTPGGAISLSANGSKDGILWALTQADENQWGFVTGKGALHAFDAENLDRELYASTEPFDYVKFSMPTIAAGKVFVGTASNKILVFGLLH
jgi:outer membrane protein assembly factor BamB